MENFRTVYFLRALCGRGVSGKKKKIKKINTLNGMAFLAKLSFQVGKGLVGQWMKQSYRADRLDSDIKAQIDDIDDHRWENLRDIVVLQCYL